MAIATSYLNELNGGVVSGPTLNGEIVYNWGLDPSLLTDNSAFAVDTSNCTPAVGWFSGRPALVLTTGAAGTTDGAQFQLITATIRAAAAGKSLLFRCGLAGTAITDQAIRFGLSIVDTSIIASDPTDHLMIGKATAETVFSVRSRASSSTVATWNLTMSAVQNNVWYDFACLMTQDATTANAGTITPAYGSGLSSGGTLTQTNALTATGSSTSKIPDNASPSLAPFIAFQNGAAATSTLYVSYLSVAIER